MAYRLKLGVWNSVFAVPSCVADEYIKIASGEQIKVLLYMLKNSDKNLTAEVIASVVGVSSDTVEEAFIFWENVGVIENNGGEITPKAGTARTFTSAAPSAPAADNIAVARAKLTADPQFPPKEIARTVSGDDAFRCLCSTYERLSGRPTKHSERNMLMIITSEIGLPSEVALMLVEYCFSIDKATPAYMKSVALDWVECGIDSIAKAEERISVLSVRNTLEGKLRRKFGMTSAFSKKQKDIIAHWAEAGLSDELIDEAYEKTLNATGKFSFPYMEKILESWIEKGITTPDQITDDKPSGDSSSSFDIDELEKSAFERYRKKE